MASIPVLSSDPSTSLRGFPSLRWLDLKGQKLVIHSEASCALQAESELVNPIMICGRLRTGKSYLMNALLDAVAFEVSPQARPLTRGVDICANLIPGSHFGWSTGMPKMVFLDVEGQGDKGLRHDVKLATPLLLISKVVILHEICPIGPSKEGLLEMLQIMMKAASQVGERSERNNLFGCLHIVLRDCCQDEEACHSIIFDTEDAAEAETDDQADAINKRNEIREAIRLSFEQRPTVWCLPKMLTHVAPEDYRSADPAYVVKIWEMREFMRGQLGQPKTLAGRPLTGRTIVSAMPSIAQALASNSPALNPPSILEAVRLEEARRLQVQFRSEVSRKQKSIPESVEPVLFELDVAIGKDQLLDARPTLHAVWDPSEMPVCPDGHCYDCFAECFLNEGKWMCHGCNSSKCAVLASCPCGHYLCTGCIPQGNAFGQTLQVVESELQMFEKSLKSWQLEALAEAERQKRNVAEEQARTSSVRSARLHKSRRKRQRIGVPQRDSPAPWLRTAAEATSVIITLGHLRHRLQNSSSSLAANSCLAAVARVRRRAAATLAVVAEEAVAAEAVVARSMAVGSLCPVEAERLAEDATSGCCCCSCVVVVVVCVVARFTGPPLKITLRNISWQLSPLQFHRYVFSSSCVCVCV